MGPAPGTPPELSSSCATGIPPAEGAAGAAGVVGTVGTVGSTGTIGSTGAAGPAGTAGSAAESAVGTVESSTPATGGVETTGSAGIIGFGDGMVGVGTPGVTPAGFIVLSSLPKIDHLPQSTTFLIKSSKPFFPAKPTCLPSSLPPLKSMVVGMDITPYLLGLS